MNKKVLLIDDDEDLLNALCITIESQGFDTEQASNAEEGFTKLKSKRPDLIVLDVMMDDELDGYNLLHQIKQDPEYSDIPIIQLTGMKDQLGVNLRSAVEDQENLPKVYYEDKPVDPLLLVNRIIKLLE